MEEFDAPPMKLSLQKIRATSEARQSYNINATQIRLANFTADAGINQLHRSARIPNNSLVLFGNRAEFPSNIFYNYKVVQI